MAALIADGLTISANLAKAHFDRLVDTVDCPLVAPCGTAMLLGTVSILG